MNFDTYITDLNLLVGFCFLDLRCFYGFSCQNSVQLWYSISLDVIKNTYTWKIIFFEAFKLVCNI